MLLLAAALNSLISSWLLFPISSALSFRVNDGWCMPPAEGIGTHCFGDFYYPASISLSGNPWENVGMPYPPWAIWIFVPFRLLNMARSNCGFYAYLLLSIVAILFPVLHIYFKEHTLSKLQAVYVSSIIIFCAPVLIAVDRGNPIVFTVPIIYLLLRSLNNTLRAEYLIYASLLFQLKPQLGIISLLAIRLFGLKTWTKWLIMNVVFMVLPFAIYGHRALINFVGWLKQMISFQDTLNTGLIYPVNLSIVNTLNIPIKVLNLRINSVLLSLIIAIFALALLGLIFSKSKERSVNSSFVALLIFPLVFMSTSYHYYLIVFIPIVTIILISEIATDSTHWYANLQNDIHQSKFSRTVALIAVPLILVPITIPWGVFPGLTLKYFSKISIQWILVPFLLFVYLISLATRNLRKTTHRN
jgi:hypothetical protein